MCKITLRAARVNKWMTIEEAAKLIGVSPATLKNWEYGKTFPKQPQIETICKVYDVPQNVLIFSDKVS